MIKSNIAIIGYILPALIITWYSSTLLDEQYERNRELQQQVWDCQGSEDGTFRTNVTVTMYHPTKRQTDSTPNITADGTKIKPWKATDYRYVALSRDLLSRWGGPFEYGDYIVIEGTDGWDGVYQVRDTMNPKWVKRVDILTTDSRFKYTDVKMYKYIKSNDGVVDNS